MMKMIMRGVLVLFLSVTTGVLHALEVDRAVTPRITLAGKVVATTDAVAFDSQPVAESGINTGDSSLLLRLDKRLYEEGVGGAVVGFGEHDEELSLHQLNAFYRSQYYRVMVGRARLVNHLIEFSTLRDGDLLSYTHVGNGSSSDEFDQLYGEQLAVDLYPGGKTERIALWSGERRNNVGVDEPAGFDSYGIGYLHEQSEALRYVKWLRKAGVMIDSQQVLGGSGEEWARAVFAGVDFNLNRNPEASWSMALQLIGNGGIDNVGSADVVHSNPEHVMHRARARSRSVVIELRHTRRPLLLTRWQGSVALAQKSFDDLVDAKQWSVVPALRYRLGAGVDLAGQVSYTHFSDGLGGGSDRLVQIGLIFALDTTFNDTFGERDSLLNLEHGYLP
jgi:hypothetical protein